MNATLKFDDMTFLKLLSDSSTMGSPFISPERKGAAVRFRQFRVANLPVSKSQLHRFIIAHLLTTLCDLYDRKNGRFFAGNNNFEDGLIDILDELLDGAKPSEDTITSLDCVLSIWNTFQRMSLIDTFCIPCNDSASALRFFVPICAAILSLIEDRNGMFVEFELSALLAERSIADATYTLERHGMTFTDFSGYEGQDFAGSNPTPTNRIIQMSGRLTPGNFDVSGKHSSQFISGLLMALPLLNDDSRILINTDIVSRPYIDMTLRVLKLFGIEIAETYSNEDMGSTIFEIPGKQNYKRPAMSYLKNEIEIDMSNAAFWYCLSCIMSLGRDEYISPAFGDMNKADPMQGDHIIKPLTEFLYALDYELCHNPGENLQACYNEVLKRAGSKMHFNHLTSCLNISIPDDNTLIVDLKDNPDLFPPLAILACGLNFRLLLHCGRRLADKESNRLIAMKDGIDKLGGKCNYYIEDLLSEGLIIYGDEMNKKTIGTLRKPLSSGQVFSYRDHRIAMAFSIATTLTAGSITIESPFVTGKSYPGFYDAFESIGGAIKS